MQYPKEYGQKTNNDQQKQYMVNKRISSTDPIKTEGWVNSGVRYCEFGYVVSSVSSKYNISSFWSVRGIYKSITK